METRWLKRNNEDGEEEKFYPITHADAVVTDDDESVGAHIKNKNNPHGVTAKQIGALPLDGSVAMTGGLTTVNQVNVHRLINEIWNTLRMYPSSSQLNGKPSAILEHVIGNAVKSYVMFNETGIGFVDKSTNYLYELYGTHNITKGTASLEAGTSALGNNQIYLKYK